MIVTSTALIKSRVNNAKRIVKDLMSGLKKPDKIYFFISKEAHHIDEGIKPHEIPKINNPKVEFIYTENIGSLRKLVPMVKKFWGKEGIRIILYDDDFGIPRDSLKNLIDYSQNINHRFHACGTAGNLYNKGRDRSKLNQIEKTVGRSIELGWNLRRPKQVDLLSSGLGLLVKPKFFPKDILEWEKYQEEFRLTTTDEHFVNYMLAKNGIPRFVVPIGSCPASLPHKEVLSQTLYASRYKHKQSQAWHEKIMEWAK